MPQEVPPSWQQNNRRPLWLSPDTLSPEHIFLGEEFKSGKMGVEEKAAYRLRSQ